MGGGPNGVRLTGSEALILSQLLTTGQEMYGLEIVEAADGGIARGSVYVLLSRMADKGLVESRLEDRDPSSSGMPRRLYKPTGVGERVFRAWTRMQDAGVPQRAYGFASLALR